MTSSDSGRKKSYSASSDAMSARLPARADRRSDEVDRIGSGGLRFDLEPPDRRESRSGRIFECPEIALKEWSGGQHEHQRCRRC